MNKHKFKEKAAELYNAIASLHSLGQCRLSDLIARFNATYNIFGLGQDTVTSKTMRVLLGENIITRDTIKNPDLTSEHIFRPNMTPQEFDQWLANLKYGSYLFKKKASTKNYTRRQTDSSHKLLIEKVIEKLGITQKELSLRVGTHSSTLSKVRHGKLNLIKPVYNNLVSLLSDNGQAVQLPFDETDTSTGTDEADKLIRNIISSVNQFLAVKKSEMEKEIDVKLGEREYYKNLSEQYAKEITNLKEKQTVKKLFNISW
jgi:transcriptional regulator with XRE-family HTH domain